MFRPEVVLSWKTGLIHIFGKFSRISGPVKCPGWRLITLPVTESGRQWPVTFDGRYFSAGRRLVMVRSGFCVRSFFQGG
jgi:hypothetical protein